MTPEQLKASILQYAIQGKLVEQRPEEGTAEELYQQIQKEKQKLIKEGKIKKEKPLAEITDEEVPFDIPESWKWVYSRDVIRYINGRAYKKPELLTKGKYPVLRVGNLFTNENWYYSDLELDDDKYCNKGDLLYAWSASFGPKIWEGEKAIYHYHIWKLDFFNPMYIKYLYYYLMADTLRIRNASHGLGYVFVTKEFMEGRFIPVPPLKEQKRIVDKIEELLPYVDRYAEAYEKLEQFNAKFPEDMKKSILQYAIQGKLVEQRPEEGTAEELYQQIQKEKQKLIKGGKIKKEKPLPEITEDEIPFEIPESWKWVRLSMVGVTQTGNTPKKNHQEYYGTYIPFIGPGDIQNGKVNYENQGLSQEGKGYGHITPENSILQVCIGGSIGKCALVDRTVAFNQQINAIFPILADSRYIYYVLDSCYFKDYMKMNAGGTATPIINRGIWDSIVLPLPPIHEQHRIVSKIEELMPYCDLLSSNI